MLRSKIRKIMILIAFLFFPLLLYYFSPALIIQGAASGIATGSFVVFGTMLLTALFLGRAWCGWVCPAGGMQEACHMVNDKRVTGGKYNFIKYIIWVPWVSLIVYFFIKAGGISKIEFFYQTNAGISVTDLQGYIIYYIVVLLIVLMSLAIGKRAFCHYLCWMAPFMVIGAKISRLLHLPSLRLKVDNEGCIQCKKCQQVCPMSLPVNDMVKENSLKNSECILCGSCVDACPGQVIRFGIR